MILIKYLTEAWVPLYDSYFKYGLLKLKSNLFFSWVNSPAGAKFEFKLRNSVEVVKAPYFSIFPWISAFIALYLRLFEFNFISTVPEILSPLKKVEYLCETPLRSVNLCLCLPRTS